VTRADLVDAVLRRVGLSRVESAGIVDAVLAEIFDVIVSERTSSSDPLAPSMCARRKNVLDAIQRPESRHGLGASRRDIQALWASPRAHKRTFVGRVALAAAIEITFKPT